jgi:class 3 adenylate cyclase/tetratricopeptide (TPR) repeat protein
MRCPRCHAENREGRRFCAACGVSLTLACPACGFSNEPGEKFCGGCGAPLRSSPTVAQAQFGPPESYTPKHLADKILTSKSALEGERKLVTVLFADLKGSMELLADRDPEEARKLLDPVLERMMEAVHRYEGTVNQVMGDGIMALFGAPLAHEDHAVRACYAALDMQGAIRRYAEEARRNFGIRTEIRIGLNSGEVVVRAIGSDLRMDYTAVGQTTHLAARLEQLASAGTTLLSADTLRLAEGFVVVKPLGPVPVKGLEAPIEVYEMLGAGPLRSRLQAAAARGLTRFVGRETEVEQLRQALGRAAAGHGQLVALVGEPGVGKSRLVWEVTHSHRTHGWLIVQAGSVSYGKATPYLPVIDLLKGYLRIEDRDDQRAVREKVTGKLLTLDEALKPAVPALLALLDVPVDDGAWAALDPPQRRRQTLEAVKRLLLRESQVQPLLVVFEDLHWIDSETQAVLDGLVESLPAARLLLLVNYRPEYMHRWGSKTYYTQLRLDSLPPESAEALLDALLGSDPALRPLTRLLIERTEGNPFFLEESVRTLVETKVLAGERGAYRLGQALPSIQVPATVQAVLAARIDRLAADEKRLLQAAAVIGKDVPFAVLQAIAAVPEQLLRETLATLQAGEFIHEVQLFPDLEYTFKHALTHEVAYGSLLQDRRRALHARIVEAIEALYADRLAEHVEQLAHHATRGEMWEKTVRYLRQAGTKAFMASANREAAACFGHALDALAHLPETRETAEQGIDLRFDLRNVLFVLGEFERGVEVLREAEGLARTLNDSRRLGWVSVYMSYNRFLMDDSIQQRVFAQHALAIGETLADIRLQVAANFLLGGACLDSGEYRRAAAMFRTAVASLDDDLTRDRCGLFGYPAVLSRAYLARALTECGAFDQGIVVGKEALRIAETLGHSVSLIQAFRFLGYLHSVKGKFPQAADLLECGLVLAREGNLPFLSAGLTGMLGDVYAHWGRVTEGLTLLLQTLQARDAMGTEGTGFYYALFLVHLGHAYVLANRLEDAQASAGRALTVARERRGQGDEAYALRLLGEIAAHRDPLDAETAEAHYRQALARATELEMRPLVAHCHLGLGKLYRRTGPRAKAEEQLTTAATMYREMAMTFWLEKAEAALGGGAR